jgi:very-short-patch-repair endonuclease
LVTLYWVIRLPEGLHGAYLRPHLLAELGRARLRDAIDEGRLISYSRSVVIRREGMTDFRTRAAAAQLSAGPRTLLTSHTSAYLHGCTAADTDRIHVLIGYARKYRPRPSEIVHVANYDPADVAVVDGLRCLSLEATLGELLCRARSSTALACADQALAFVGQEHVAEVKTDLAVRIARRPDPRGRRRGGFLLDLASGLPESPAESWLLLMVVDHGFPLPEPQFKICDLMGREVYRLDFAWPHLRIALEYDGYEAHENRRAEDATRDADLKRRGWKVIRAEASDLRDPTRLFRRLSAELGVSEWGTRSV